MRVSQIWIGHRGRATVFYEGADPMTDYCPLTCDISQKLARKFMADFGVAPWCYVSTGNARNAGEPWPKENRSAKRFAEKTGLPYKDRVWFPRRSTEEEAEADRGLEPGPTKVEFMGQHWRDDNTWGDVFQVQLVA